MKTRKYKSFFFKKGYSQIYFINILQFPCQGCVESCTGWLGLGFGVLLSLPIFSLWNCSVLKAQSPTFSATSASHPRILPEESPRNTLSNPAHQPSCLTLSYLTAQDAFTISKVFNKIFLTESLHGCEKVQSFFVKLYCCFIPLLLLT